MDKIRPNFSPMKRLLSLSEEGQNKKENERNLI
jgi:hypothetical protein